MGLRTTLQVKTCIQFSGHTGPDFGQFSQKKEKRCRPRDVVDVKSSMMSQHDNAIKQLNL